MVKKRFPTAGVTALPGKLGDDLLVWYDHHARKLPWRTGPRQSQNGASINPYHVWLSEVMLQQTTVGVVGDYYRKFLDLWPNVEALAAAEEDQVLRAWAGLGYYSRARNLKKCADIVARDYGGEFPATAQALRALPGIGDYTAAAIAAIAFGHAEPVVDGNIERIIARLACIDTPLPKAKPQIRAIMGELVPDVRPGDFVQAMMDLGAGVCTPRNADCTACPIRRYCAASVRSEPTRWPVKPIKKVKPQRKGAAFIAVNGDGAILLQKRHDKGLLAKMSQVPTTNWTAAKDGETGADAAPFSSQWVNRGTIRHTFTHFHLTLHVYRTDIVEPLESNGWWISGDALENEALPSVFCKAIAKALQ